jgi:hypothetical protein
MRLQRLGKRGLVGLLFAGALVLVPLHTARSQSGGTTITFVNSFYLVYGSTAIQVSRQGDLSGASSCSYTTRDGTATASSGAYDPASGTLVFGAGQSTATITITASTSGDGGDGTFYLDLSNFVGASGGAIQTADLVVSLAPLPTVQFDSSAYSVQENAGFATITVTLSEPPTEPVTVNYATSDGTATAPNQYQSASGTLTFPPDTVSQTFQVAIVDDQTPGPNTTVNLTLSNPTNATLGSPSAAVLTIVDTDSPLVQFSASSYSVYEDDGAGTITVTLDAAQSGTVTVNYATSDGTAIAGTNYSPASGSLTFAPGVVCRTFQVPVLDDGNIEPTLTVNLTLSNPVGAALGSPSTAVLSIFDTDSAPTVQFDSDNSQTANFTANESDGTATIVVTLSYAFNQTVTVAYATSDGTAVAGTDYQATNGTLTFNPGDVVQSFQVPIYDDGLPGPNKTVNLTLSNPTNATLGSPSTAVLTIIDDTPLPQPSVAFSSSSYSVNESAGTATITVTLSASSSLPVNVYYTTSDGTATEPDDYQGASGLLSFAPGEVSQSFTVSVTDNGVPGPSKTVNLALSYPQNAMLGSPSMAVLTIVNDNLVPAPGYVAFAGGDGTSTPPVYQVNKAAGYAIITVLAGQSSQTVSVNYATSDGTATSPTDYTPASGTLTFPPGTTSQTFTVLLNQNSTTSSDVTVNMELCQPETAALGQPATAVLNINAAKPTATIVPGTGQSGTTGDVVPSRMAPGGTKHYVSPKDAVSDVVLKANIVGAVKFADAFQWKGGTPVPGSPEQCQVSREATGKTTVQIIRNSDNAVMDTMNVWIVWSSLTADRIMFNPGGTFPAPPGKGFPIFIRQDNKDCRITAGYTFKSTIAPAAIIGAANADVPDLTGANATPPPDVVATDDGVYNKGVSLAKGANRKWDISRTLRVKFLNPNNVDFSDKKKYPTKYVTSYLNWPREVGGEDVVGNDNTNTGTETNDPYANGGTLTDWDTPLMTLYNTEGANGNTVEKHANWAEFTRLEINKKWYRISDDFPWRVTWKFMNSAGNWADNESSAAKDWAVW